MIWVYNTLPTAHMMWHRLRFVWSKIDYHRFLVSTITQSFVAMNKKADCNICPSLWEFRSSKSIIVDMDVIKFASIASTV